MVNLRRLGLALAHDGQGQGRSKAGGWNHYLFVVLPHTKGKNLHDLNETKEDK